MLRVTEILRLNGLVDLQWLTDHARDKGSAVHLATELDDRGDLDEASVHPEVAGRLESWRRFKRESGVVIEEIESPIEHVAMGYRGTPDRVVLWVGSRWIFDLKPPSKIPAHRLQLCGYVMGWAAMQPGIASPRRATVHLQDDGSAARVEEYTDRRDFDVWKGAVSVAHFKVNHGLS